MDLDRLAAVPSPLFVKHLSIPARSLLQASSVATLQPAEPTSSVWPLAQIESLTIAFDTIESQQEVLSIMRSRHGEADDENESTGPMNLKAVELRGRGGAMTEGLVEEITRVLGEVNVFWHD